MRRPPRDGTSAADTGSQSIELGDGERRGGVTLKFWKYGAISGTVADEIGEPIIGIQVRVFRRSIIGGRLRFTSFGNMPTTDDRGAYRVANLTPGDYVVGVVSTQATVPVSLQEAMSEVGAARDDLRRELDRSSSGLGRISGLGGGRRVGPWLLQTSPEFGTSTVPNPPGDGGKVFVYPTVFHPTASTVSGGTIITVASGDEHTGTDFHLKPVPTSQVSGHLVGADGEQDYTSLSLMPAGSEDAQRTYDLATATAMTDATGAFTFIGVPAGEYTIRVLKIPPRPDSLAIEHDDRHPDWDDHDHEQQRSNSASTDPQRSDLVGECARFGRRPRRHWRDRDLEQRRQSDRSR